MRLTYTLRRGASGLGIDVGGGNEIVEVVAGGQAAADGVARPGDIVEAVDGVALAGKGMSDVLVAGRASYEMLVRRPKSGALETQALAAGLLGADAQGEKPPVRLVCAKVRRGKNGLGLDLGHFNRVQSLVPGSPAAEDLSVLPGDVIAAVDGTLIGCGSLPPLLTPGRQQYSFLLMRADRIEAIKPPQSTPPAKPRQLTEDELALVLEDEPKAPEPKPEPPLRTLADYAKPQPTPAQAEAVSISDGETESAPKDEVDELMDKYDKNGDGKFGREEVRTMLAQIGGHRQRPRKAKPQWQFAEDDEEEDTDEEEEGEEEDTDEEEEEDRQEEQHAAAPTQAEKPIVAPPTRALMGETIEEGDEDLSTVVSAWRAPASNYVGPVTVDVLWDCMSCPLGSTTAKAKSAEENAAMTASLTSLVQRVRLRLQTACARGAPLGNVVAFGEFGNLTVSPLAQALVAGGVQIVACGEPGNCPRGGVASALIAAMSLRAVDLAHKRTPASAQPLVVASARPEVQFMAQELANRGADIGIAAPLESLKLMKPRGGGAPTPPKNVQFYGWPQLYPTSADELISGTKKAVATRGAGLTHVATHTPRPLPMWL